MGAAGSVAEAGAETRRGGYDLTFSADKSISALWAVAPAAMKAAIEAAQETAVRAALALLQERAAETRRGKGGATREPVQLFGGLFQHGDTRAGDPDLHTHAVVLNVAQRRDGTWGTVANEKLYQWKMAAGALYRVALAEQLQTTLGLAIERHGERQEFIRITGVPEALCADWSKRRRAIEAEAAALGFSTGSDATRAAGLTLATRGKKGYTEGREARWHAEAAVQGWGAEQARALAGRSHETPADARNRAWAAMKARVRETVEHDSVFTEQVLWQVTAEAAAGAFPAADVAGLVTRLEAEGVVVRLPGPDPRGRIVYSTRETIEDEVATRALARQAIQAAALVVPEAAAQAAVAGSEKTLSAEQAAAAIHAMTVAGGLALVEGAPGVGKSTLLKPVVDGYRAAGAGPVIACAVAWRQARSLGEEVGADDALAAAALLSRWRTGELVVDARTVLVVDELGQWSARQARTLMEVQRATGCRVVGVGDRRQLQPIGAGPGMRLLAQEAEPVTVDRIIRQTDTAARAAVRAVMDGDAAAAVAAHRQRGHIVEANSHDGAVAAVADRLMQARAAGMASVAIAETWRDVRAISAAVRTRLRAEGALGDDVLTFTGSGNRPGQSVTMALAVGDAVRFRHRDDRLGVVNGDTGHVLAIAGTVATVETGGRRIAVDIRQYRDKDGRCPLSYAYASTLAAAQGVTVEAPILLGTDRLTKQAATVALSRGTGWTTVVVDRAALEDAIRAGRPVTSTEVDAHLARAWSRDVEKVSALDHLDAGQVEAWVAGWRGSLPAAALAPAGRPVAEVVDLARLRAERQHAANQRRLGTAGARLEEQGRRLAGAALERVRDLAERLAPLGARLETQGELIAVRRAAEAEALAVLDRQAAAGAVFRVEAGNRRTLTPLTDADAGVLRHGWSERVAARFDALAQAMVDRERQEAERRQAHAEAERRRAQEAAAAERAAAEAAVRAEAQRQAAEAEAEAATRAEVAKLQALLADGRAITLTPDRTEIEGLSADQLARIQQHWTALFPHVHSVAAAQVAQHQERVAAYTSAAQRVSEGDYLAAVELFGAQDLAAQDTPEGRAVRRALDAVPAAQAILAPNPPPEAASKPQESPRAPIPAPAQQEAAHKALYEAAERKLQPWDRWADAVRVGGRSREAQAERDALRAAAMAELPEEAQPLARALRAPQTPPIWRDAVALALAQANPLEAAHIAGEFAVWVGEAEGQARAYREAGGARQRAVEDARRSVEQRHARLREAVETASADPKADLELLQRATRQEIEKHADVPETFIPRLRGYPLTAERAAAKQAREEVAVLAMAYTSARERARAAQAALEEWRSTPEAQAGQEAQAMVKAMAAALNAGPAGPAFPLDEAAKALAEHASPREIQQADVPDEYQAWALREQHLHIEAQREQGNGYEPEM